MKAASGIPFAVTLLLMGATLAGAILTEHNSITQLARPLEQIPRDLAGWSVAAEAPLDSAVLDQLKPTSYVSRMYRRADHSLGLLVIYYAQQRAGESMHSPEHCLPGGGWQIQRREIDSLPLAGRAVQVNRYQVSHSGDNYVIYYWY